MDIPVSQPHNVQYHYLMHQKATALVIQNIHRKENKNLT